MTTKTVSIIGTAGRGADERRLSAEMFRTMVEQTRRQIVDVWKLTPWNEVRLVSGGAAGGDHVAVRLFLDHVDEGARLTLHMPCDFDIVTLSTAASGDVPRSRSSTAQFRDSGERSWQSNPGASANMYHRRFARQCGWATDTTLDEIAAAVEAGADVVVHRGFHARNRVVAQSDYVFAMTFSGDRARSNGDSDRSNGDSAGSNGDRVVGDSAMAGVYSITGRPSVPKEGGTADAWRQARGTKHHLDLCTYLR
jgi:hypothetical protein